MRAGRVREGKVGGYDRRGVGVVVAVETVRAQPELSPPVGNSDVHLHRFTRTHARTSLVPLKQITVVCVLRTTRI